MAPIASQYAHLHLNPRGPGDARPTALQIIREEDLIDKLQGKVYLVTGANDTTGLETARALHMTGARVFITTRSQEKNQASVRSIVTSNGGIKGGIEAITMELGNIQSVRAAAKEFLSKSERLDGLICNAGTFPQILTRTVDGFESAFGVNHLGHFALFQELKNILLASSTPGSASRVVMVSSIGHRMSEIDFADLNYDSRVWEAIPAYGQSKTANIYMANQIEQFYGSKGLHAFSLQPGGVDSNLWITCKEQRDAVLKDDKFGRYLKTTQQGAATSVWAAVSKDLEGKGGLYLESLQEIGRWEGPEAERMDWTVPGYEGWIYDVEKAERLWTLSKELIDGKGKKL